MLVYVYIIKYTYIYIYIILHQPLHVNHEATHHHRFLLPHCPTKTIKKYGAKFVLKTVIMKKPSSQDSRATFVVPKAKTKPFKPMNFKSTESELVRLANSLGCDIHACITTHIKYILK
jgi:hypothetical protein